MPRRPEAVPDAVRRALETIDQQLGNPDLSLKWMAERVLYLDADYFGKLFKRTTGVGFTEYVHRRKVEKAIEWMEHRRFAKIGDIAERLGFVRKPSYFTDVFRRVTGKTPTAFLAEKVVRRGGFASGGGCRCEKRSEKI